MRRIALFLAVSLLLGGCRFLQKRATFTLTFDVPSDAVREELIWSALRIMESTAVDLKSPLTDKEVSVGSGSTTISVTLKNAKAAKALTQKMTTPFTLQFMRKVEDGKGTVTVENHGSFEDLGVGQKELFWAEASEGQVDGKSAVRLLFSKEGFPVIQKMLKDNRSEMIGLFVQERLVSTLDPNSVKGDIVIRGIPSPEMARDFADRVNVGLHVTVVSDS